ncbi:MAG: HDOD domain-containing protein [Thermoguttaceae bacterium]|nr:HDOD domain-containing protein [Thermoguttaceae bacterium]MDW8079945.1 HDOD domain-containing protein [Thermoguttaceae bacterium]
MALANSVIQMPVDFRISDTAWAVSQRVGEMSTLPQVVRRILQVAGDERAGAQELKEAVEGDPALTARVIRLVNSAATGLANRITNLQMAVAYLGVRQIRNLAWTAFVSELFRSGEAFGHYRRSQLWNHCVAVGILARMIAVREGRTDFEDFFLAGLLHDVGIVLADQYDHERFRKMILELPERTALENWEQAYLGYTHAELGAAVGIEWHFPPSALAAIRWHHSTGCPLAEYEFFVHTVALANYLVTLKGTPSVGKAVVRAPVEAVQALNLTRPEVEALLEDFRDEMIRQVGLFVLD